MFSKNLKYLRNESGMEQLELANRLGRKSGSSVSEWEKGTYTPRIGTLGEIANIFNVDLDDLMNTDLSATATTTIEKTKAIMEDLTKPRQQNVHNYAVNQLEEQQAESNVTQVDFNKISEEPTEYIKSGRATAAGSAILNDDNDTRLDVRPASLVPTGADELVEVVGDSMVPLLEDGQEIFIRYQPTVESGEVAIVRIEDEGVTCKRVYAMDGQIVLKSENKAYDDMTFTPDQVTILAKVLL